MNWKLVLQLSLVGLIMAVATVYVIPANIEPFCWLPIFLAFAYLIARNTASRRFLHGLCLGLLNSVWITSTHVLLFKQYLEHHPNESAMLARTAFPTHPRVTMAAFGPIGGLIFGTVIGLFALAAGKFFKTPTSPQKEKAIGQNA